MAGQLNDKVAWIVGAGGTLGAAVGAAFAREGAILALSGRDRIALEATAAAVSAPRRRGSVVAVMDITVGEQVEQTARAIVAELGRIDILVNSVTCPLFGPFQSLTDDNWNAVLDAKLLGYMRTCRAVLPYMIRQHHGTIVNVSGLGGHMPLASVHLPGSIANAGVNLLSKGLAQLHGKDGIRVNVVSPGPIASPRLERIMAAELKAGSDHPAQAAVPRYTPVIGVGQPEHVADVALFLASDQSRYLTGVNLHADGGATPTL